MRKRGFTLVELIIVVAIIVVLTALVTLTLVKANSKAKLSRVATEESQIAQSVNEYAQDNQLQYPGSTSTQYPADVGRGVPPGLEKYLAGGTWPTSVWPHGVFDWDNWSSPYDGSQVYQITYQLCDLNDPDQDCKDPVLFPNFTRNSSIFYCIQGTCAPHQDDTTDPAYCVNCLKKEVNY